MCRDPDGSLVSCSRFYHGIDFELNKRFIFWNLFVVLFDFRRSGVPLKNCLFLEILRFFPLEMLLKHVFIL